MSRKTTHTLTWTDRFREHPDSVAGRRMREALDRTLERLKQASTNSAEDDGLSWLDLTADSTDAEVDEACRNMSDREPAQTKTPLILRTPAVISACPLDPSWRLWSMHSERSQFSPGNRRAVEDLRASAAGDSPAPPRRGAARLGSGSRRCAVPANDDGGIRRCRGAICQRIAEPPARRNGCERGAGPHRSRERTHIRSRKCIRRVQSFYERATRWTWR